MAVLHPRTGRSRTEFGPQANVGVWLSFVSRHQSAHRVDHTVGRRWCCHGGSVLGMARPLPHSLKSAALCSAAAMATPYVHGYDLCVLAIAVAFLVKDCLARGFLPG